MTMTVKTKSGSIYYFTQKDGRTLLRRGLMTGEVICIKNAPITIGKGINMDICKDDLYCNPDDSNIMLVNTSPVTEISVIL